MNDRGSLLASARELKPWLVEIRRGLHMRPELGLEEVETAAEITRRLGELGIPASRRGTAVVGLLQGEHPGPCVALRADMDALPLLEAEGREYGSRIAGRMHACGHDAHVAVQLGAARLLEGLKDSLHGSVKFLFQPAEETVGGALAMVGDGCLEGPRVERVYGLHVMPFLPVGAIETRRGTLNGCSASLRVEVLGKSGHGAYPETGVDAVLIAANVVIALNLIVSRNVSPLDSAVLTVGTIRGGTAANILADSVGMEVMLRATSDSARGALVARAVSVCEGIASSMGGSARVKASLGYPALVNHDEAVDAVAKAAGELLGPSSLVWKERPSMGVEDFSYFIRERSGAFYHLGCGLGGGALHSREFDIDEDCLPVGAAMQAALALGYLEEKRKGNPA